VGEAGIHPNVTALSDGAILYGAQRYFDGVHDDGTWPFRHQYRKEDDRALFLEFLNNLYLYDRIVLDNRPIEPRESAAYGELERFLSTVNSQAGAEIFARESLDLEYADEQAKAGRSGADDVPTSVQRRVCALIASYVKNGRTAGMQAVSIPWAYHQSFHQDHPAITSALRDLGVDERWVPFTLFVWRAIWYGAIAHFQAKTRHHAFAYVAAPRRIQALQAVFDAKTLAAFQFPREAVRAISFDLPDISPTGYDFGYLDFMSPFEVTALSAEIGNAPPTEALRMVLAHRRSPGARKSRSDWADLISNGSSTCVIGTTVVQIMRDMTVHGHATQSVRLRAVPA
jgi:hypothetical protein